MTARWARVVLTGASGGIGAELASQLAGPGVTLLLIGRDAARLDAVAATVAAHGGTAEAAALDVTDAAAMAARIGAFVRDGVDLVIANAGVSGGTAPDGTPESAAAAQRLMAVNYGGILNTVEPALPALRRQRHGQVAVMSSIAALRPLPDMAGYSASKAAIRAHGIALRGALRRRGVAVSVICPGFVTSPMSARHRGFKPFTVPADRAAARILRGLARKAPFITFPWPLALLTWLDNRMPAWLTDRAAEGFATRIDPH